MKNIPKITAILPNYNDAHLISRALNSLIHQSEPFFEIIIVDDGSTDNSLLIIREFKQKYNYIKLVQHAEKQGVPTALNTGIEHATGDYVLLCAADDWYDQDLVKITSSAIIRFPEAGLICGDAVIYRSENSKGFTRTLPYQQKNTWITAEQFQHLAITGYVSFNSGGGMVLKKDAVIQANMLYPETYWYNDWVLYFIIAMRHGIYYTNHIFIHIHIRKDGYSKVKRKLGFQKKVFVDTMLSIKQHSEDLFLIFKKSALLPDYSLRFLPLFLLNASLRKFITKRLLWNFMMHNQLIVHASRLLPFSFKLQLRKLLRI